MQMMAGAAEGSTARKGRVVSKEHAMLFGLVTVVFFLWGMSNNLTDILVQQFRKSFELNLLRAQLVQTAVFFAYGVMAIPAAVLMRRFGYKAGLITGLCVFAAGTILFLPAAILSRYALFLAALFVVGCGSSILETVANPFMAQLGDAESSERRLNLAQAFNPPGCILGVLLGTWFIFSGVEKTGAEVESMRADGTYAAYLHSEIMRVVPTYVVLGVVVLLLAYAIGRMAFPRALDSPCDGHEETQHGGFRALLGYPTLLLAVVAQFCYVGAQVGTWSTFIPYLKAYTLTTEKTAGYLLTGTLIALAAGRFCSTWLMRFVPPAGMMAVYALINAALVVVSVSHPGMYGGYCLLASSFFMSIMFPTIFAMGIKGLGELTKLGSSLLVMAVVGGAIVPPLMGAVSNRVGSVAAGYWIPVGCYLVVALSALAMPRLQRKFSGT